jgi:hypothetical protein
MLSNVWQTAVAISFQITKAIKNFKSKIFVFFLFYRIFTDNKNEFFLESFKF